MDRFCREGWPTAFSWRSQGCIPCIRGHLVEGFRTPVSFRRLSGIASLWRTWRRRRMHPPRLLSGKGNETLQSSTGKSCTQQLALFRINRVKAVSNDKQTTVDSSTVFRSVPNGCDKKRGETTSRGGGKISRRNRVFAWEISEKSALSK